MVIRVVAFLLAGFAVPAHAQWPDARWDVCSADAQCVVIEGVCGGWRAVNRAYEKEALETIRQEQMVSSCVSMASGEIAKPNPKPNVRCEAERCSILVHKEGE